MESRSHGSDRAPDGLRSIHVTHLLEVAQDHHFPIPERKRQNRSAKALDLLGARQVVERMLECRRELRLQLRILVEQRQQRAIAFEPAPNEISGDSTEPGRNRCASGS